MPTIHNKRRKYQPERKAQERRKTKTVFNYNSQVWRKFRKAKLQESPLCVKCLGMDPPRYTVATVLDHIKPINEGGAEWDSSNLQSLCATCHNQKSGREAHSHFNINKQ